MSKKPVCLVLGAGAGIGGHVGMKFASEGYHAVLARRSDEEGLNKLVAQIEEAGGSATGRLVNAVQENAIEDLVVDVEKNIGPIQVVLFNLGAQIGNRSLQDTTLKTFALGWQMATFGLFRLAKVVIPSMVERGGGSILVTSATAAMRGNAGQHSHAAAMGGRRMLCQTLNAEYASKGVHIAHILIDGAVDAPDTLGKLLGQETVPETARRPRARARRAFVAGRDERDLLPHCPSAPLGLDARVGFARLFRSGLVESRALRGKRLGLGGEPSQ